MNSFAKIVKTKAGEEVLVLKGLMPDKTPALFSIAWPNADLCYESVRPCATLGDLDALFLNARRHHATAIIAAASGFGPAIPGETHSWSTSAGRERIVTPDYEQIGRTLDRLDARVLELDRARLNGLEETRAKASDLLRRLGALIKKEKGHEIQAE